MDCDNERGLRFRMIPNGSDEGRQQVQSRSRWAAIHDKKCSILARSADYLSNDSQKPSDLTPPEPPTTRQPWRKRFRSNFGTYRPLSRLGTTINNPHPPPLERLHRQATLQLYSNCAPTIAGSCIPYGIPILTPMYLPAIRK